MRGSAGHRFQMRWAQQYKVTRFALRAIRLLIAHPGPLAAEFGYRCWPHLSGLTPGIMGVLARRNLKHLIRQELVFIRYWPHKPRIDGRKRGDPKPRKQYYVTEKAYLVHEFYARNPSAPFQDGNSANRHRTCRPGGGAGAQRGTGTHSGNEGFILNSKRTAVNGRTGGQDQRR